MLQVVAAHSQHVPFCGGLRTLFRTSAIVSKQSGKRHAPRTVNCSSSSRPWALPGRKTGHQAAASVPHLCAQVCQHGRCRSYSRFWSHRLRVAGCQPCPHLLSGCTVPTSVRVTEAHWSKTGASRQHEVRPARCCICILQPRREEARRSMVKLHS